MLLKTKLLEKFRIVGPSEKSGWNLEWDDLCPWEGNSEGNPDVFSYAAQQIHLCMADCNVFKDEV